jgi:hypothetical protein
MASKNLILRFSKFDKFNQPVFLASSANTQNPEELDSHRTLSKWYKALDNKNFGTFLPIYVKNEFASIRFKHNQRFSHMQERNLYDVSFTIRTVVRDGKTYCNIYIDSLKMVKKAKPLDYGDILDLDM